MNLLRAASTVSLLTLASRITGLVRELMIASLFGASASTDAFNIAFRIPNLLRRLFAEGAFSQAFVPILAETRTQQGDKVTHDLTNAVATILMAVLLFTVVLGVTAAPLLVWLMASGLQAQGNAFHEATVMTRMMFPYIGFMSLVALSAGILNTWKQFGVPAFTPVLLNVSSIMAAWWLAPLLPHYGIPSIYALAIGVMVGGVLQLAIQIPALRKIGMMPRFGLSLTKIRGAWQHPGVKRVLKQMAPAVLGVSVAQLSLLINTQIASHQGAGAVSWLTYADRLMEFPTALLGVALGVVLLPQLSATQAKNDHASYSSLLDWGLRLVVMLTLPCALALIVFTVPLVTTLYHYGRFNANDVQQTVVALMGYGVGLMGLVAVKVLAPGFYAKQDIRTPVKIAITVLILTQGFNFIFVPWLGHAGLALSIGLGALVNATWLLIGLHRRGSYSPMPGWWRFFAKVLIATLVMGAWLGWVAHAIDWVLLAAHHWLRIGYLAGALAVAGLLYFGVLAALGLKPSQFVRKG